jgi:CheY-like chemotaxis protein
MTDPASNLTILVVEDDDVAAEAVLRSLVKAGMRFPTVWAEDGEQALNALRGSDPERPVPRPRGAAGPEHATHERFRVPAGAASRPRLCDDVVFVLTTSDADTASARLHETSRYMVKSAAGRSSPGSPSGSVSAHHPVAHLSLS